MTDRNRMHHQQDHDEQPSSENTSREPMSNEGRESTARRRSNREQESVADDRGPDAQRERRTMPADREDVDVGSEADLDLGMEDDDIDRSSR